MCTSSDVLSRSNLNSQFDCPDHAVHRQIRDPDEHCAIETIRTWWFTCIWAGDSVNSAHCKHKGVRFKFQLKPWLLNHQVQVHLLQSKRYSCYRKEKNNAPPLLLSPVIPAQCEKKKLQRALADTVIILHLTSDSSFRWVPYCDILPPRCHETYMEPYPYSWPCPSRNAIMCTLHHLEPAMPPYSWLTVNSKNPPIVTPTPDLRGGPTPGSLIPETQHCQVNQ